MQNTVTEKQKNSVRFCENILGVRYGKNLDDKVAVSQFLDKYLLKAQKTYQARLERKASQLKSFYSTYGAVLDRKKNKRG